MFAQYGEEKTELERFAAWAARAKDKGTKIIANVKAVKSAATDIRQAIKPVSANDPANIALANQGMQDMIFGIPSTYVYIIAGLAIAGGIGYIAYNRLK